MLPAKASYQAEIAARNISCSEYSVVYVKGRGVFDGGYVAGILDMPPAQSVNRTEITSADISVVKIKGFGVDGGGKDDSAERTVG